MIFGRAWSNLAKGKGKEHGSVLDLPDNEYDPVTRLPRTVQIGSYLVRPMVTLDNIHDHLILLSAFHELAQRQGATLHRLADSAAFEYERWAQYVLPARRSRRTSGHSSSSSAPMSRTSSQPPTLASPSASSDASSSSPLSDLSLTLPQRRTLAPEDLPPLHVLMCWHAHLLIPRQFATDAQGTYAMLAQLPFPLAEAAAAVRAGTLPTELEHVSMSSSMDSLHPVESISGWRPPDISAAVQRQARIVAAVHQAGWLDAAFVSGDRAPFQRAIVRYHAWLDLEAAIDGAPLAPTVDIEIVWRTHQLRGARYREETSRLLGAPLDFAARGDEHDLKRTAALWQKRFRHDYVESRSRAPGERFAGLVSLPFHPRNPIRRSTVP